MAAKFLLILSAFLAVAFQINAQQNVDQYLQQEMLSIRSGTKCSTCTQLPRGTILLIGSTEIDNWFNLNGAGLGEYAGWFLCDGRNGTPDMRARFLINRQFDHPDYNTIGAKGGESHVKLSINEMPSHTHTTQPHSHSINLNTASSGSHTHTYKDIYYSQHSSRGPTSDYVNIPSNFGSGANWDYDNSGHQFSRTTYSDGAHVHTVQGQSQSSYVNLDANGGNLAHENRPPYYVVQYIIYAPTTIIG
jgi:microcystin-dependent protein